MKGKSLREIPKSFDRNKRLQNNKSHHSSPSPLDLTRYQNDKTYRDQMNKGSQASLDLTRYKTDEAYQNRMNKSPYAGNETITDNYINANQNDTTKAKHILCKRVTDWRYSGMIIVLEQAIKEIEERERHNHFNTAHHQLPNRDLESIFNKLTISQHREISADLNTFAGRSLRGLRSFFGLYSNIFIGPSLHEKRRLGDPCDKPDKLDPISLYNLQTGKAEMHPISEHLKKVHDIIGQHEKNINQKKSQIRYSQTSKFAKLSGI